MEKNELRQERSSTSYNNSTRVFVVILGILTGCGGFFHGIFETLQGNKSTVDILEEGNGDGL